MKKILVTGSNGFIGNNFEEWIKDYNDYQLTKLSVRDNSWTSVDFSHYDVVLHLAGIAHVSTDPQMETKYYEINRDLTIQIASKSKNEGVKQFIFMSSIIVYGNKNSKILWDTIPNPENFYGRSKLEAEEGINKLSSEEFSVVVIRPPMIYGKSSKGNYPRLSKLAKVMPFFPYYPNKRSVLHIDNLCEFIRLIIDNQEAGVFFPQNKELVGTIDIVKKIREVHNKKTFLVKGVGFIITKMINHNETLKKVFGDLIIDENVSKYKYNYHVHNFENSIRETEK
ncbi:NAD-dependent epimerase/dehydratase family protein [Priestia megaterium]|uniref:NAD-dependent epimerase/dehydratase family protein n=1 Tax=Priestia megaterium TaxID=1404 RepID=UPI00203CE14C|nr:NAD-dependent epimerase/dehydratase family protein [Priestia megaterium]MCM3150849.1 NAD-dependent epimerase/dehydratase family protein [Priestia megaterium]